MCSRLQLLVSFFPFFPLTHFVALLNVIVPYLSGIEVMFPFLFLIHHSVFIGCALWSNTGFFYTNVLPIVLRLINHWRHPNNVPTYMILPDMCFLWLYIYFHPLFVSSRLDLINPSMATDRTNQKVILLGTGDVVTYVSWVLLVCILVFPFENHISVNARKPFFLGWKVVD